MRLHEYAVDLLDADDLFAVSDGLKHAGDTQVTCAPQDALRGTYDEGDGVLAADSGEIGHPFRFISDTCSDLVGHSRSEATLVG